MWPWGHVAVGYLVFLAYGGLTGLDWRENHLLPATVAVLATQVPDVVDKPLAWWFHALPSGRSLGHSLFAVVCVSLAFWYVTRRYDREALAIPFSLGYLSHLFADGYGQLFAGHWRRVSYFFYPFTSAPTYPDSGGFAAHVAGLHLSASMELQLGLDVVAVALFCGIEYRLRRRGVARPWPW